MYVTDVQYGPAKAASYNGGDFMAIAGYKWNYVQPIEGTNANSQFYGKPIIDKNGMPTYASGTYYAVGYWTAKRWAVRLSV